MTKRFPPILLIWVLVGLALLVLLAIDAPTSVRLYYSNIAQTTSAVIAGLICFATRNAFPPASPLRKAWSLIGAGVIAWGIGSAIFAGYPVLNDGEETPYPYYSDLGFLLTSPLIAFGLLAFKRSTGLKAPLWGIALATIVLMAFGYWCYLANEAGLGEGPVHALTALGYILFDPILLAVTVLVASSFRGGAVGRAWWMVVVGVTLYFFANQIYTYLRDNDAYTTGSWIDLGWIYGFGFIAWAGLTTRNLMR